MKKMPTLFAVAIFLLIFSKQIFACDYYEDEEELEKILKTGVYYKNISGKVCSSDKKSIMPIKNGKAHGKAKVVITNFIFDDTIKANFKNGKREGSYKAYYSSGVLKLKVNYKNDELEGLAKWYYRSGVLYREANYKNGKEEGLVKYYDESGTLKEEVNYKNGEIIK